MPSLSGVWSEAFHHGQPASPTKPAAISARVRMSPGTLTNCPERLSPHCTCTVYGGWRQKYPLVGPSADQLIDPSRTPSGRPTACSRVHGPLCLEKPKWTAVAVLGVVKAGVVSAMDTAQGQVSPGLIVSSELNWLMARRISECDVVVIWKSHGNSPGSHLANHPSFPPVDGPLYVRKHGLSEGCHSYT